MRTIIAICLVCVSGLSCDRQQGTSVSATQQSSEASDLSFQQAVDAMRSLQIEHEFPKHLLQRDAKKRGDEFDVQRYFTVLRHLSMEEGYVLDYVYHYFEVGGSPVLYARKKTQPPYATETDLKNSVRKEAHLDEVDAAYDEYRSAISQIRRAHSDSRPAMSAPSTDDAKLRAQADERLKARLAAIPDYEYWRWYLNHVRSDGTEQGYLEYMALSLLGGQFYLFWHENYHDTRIICDRSEIRKIVDELAPAPPLSSKPSEPAVKSIKPLQDESLSDLPEWYAAETQPVVDALKYISDDWETLNPFSTKKFRTNALEIDPTPRVQVGQQETKVTIVTFSKWRGFASWQFTISTRFPHKLLRSSDETLASYDCGVFF